MKVVIPSKGRSDTIRKHTLALFPDATVVVDEAEAGDYAEVVPAKQLATHKGLKPIVVILNWVLDTFEDDVVVIADDDIVRLTALPGWSPRRYRDPAVALQVLQATAQCAIDAGCGVFGFNQSPHPLYFSPTEPFRLARWVGSVIGFVGDHGLRYDEKLQFHEDADLALQALLRQRIVWCEDRWSFEPLRLTNPGGMTGQRSAAAEKSECEHLLRKWGKYLAFSTAPAWGTRQTSTTMMTSLRVSRKQAA